MGAGPTTLAVVLCVGLAAGGVAQAAFPGSNGRIVYASQRADGRYEIFTSKSDGTDRRSLTLGENPKYSRAGSRVAFIRNGDVYVVNVDGTGMRKLTNTPATEINPSWSPDDRRIAFARSVGGRFDVFVVAVEGNGQARNLTRSSAADDRGPAWSPNGTLIAHERDGQIRVMRADRSAPRTLTTAGRNVSPAWSPDGTRIAFAGKASEDGNWEIYVIASKGAASARALTADPAIDLDPAWSPDGKSIVFTSTRDGNYDIHVMSSDGRDVVQLVQGSAEDTTSDWQSVDAGPIESGVLKVVACNDTGTGFLVGPRLVVTADHVVSDAGQVDARIVLRRDGRRLTTATVVGRDTKSDLALLRTTTRVRGHAFRFAVSTPKKGDTVAVHGYPYDAGRVVRRGEIEGRGVSTVGDDTVARKGLVQIEVGARGGMSGSPLVRSGGELGEAGHVLGIVIQVLDRGDVAFAVPAPVIEAKVARWRTASSLRPVGRC